MSSLRTIVKAKIHAFNYFHKQTVILFCLRLNPRPIPAPTAPHDNNYHTFSASTPPQSAAKYAHKHNNLSNMHCDIFVLILSFIGGDTKMLHH